MPKEEEIIKPEKINARLLRGFKDVLPEDEKYWQYVFKAVLATARAYDFDYINTPILEDVGLFERTVGETSDIVAKEMFRFNLPKKEEDQDTKQSVVLRPEGTAPVMRAYLEHGMVNKPQPVKLWYWGPMFRYDRPQAGRYRQFNHWGLEIIGDAAAMVDAQLIIAMYNIYKSLGLDVVIPINSIGDKQCRPSYINALADFLETRTKDLCNNCRKRQQDNPLRVFDCKELACQEVLSEAPQMLDYLCEDCRNHFIAVLEYLDEVDIPYALASFLVRGLDYYTRTTFEIYLKKDYETGSKLNALGGGGRYDDLAESLGGRTTPAVGAASGVERAIIALKDQDISVPVVKKYDIFIAQLGPEAKKKALRLFESLKAEGWQVAESFSKDGLSSQLEKADKLGAMYTLILGQKEIIDGTIIIRDMSSGIQEEVNFDKLFNELNKRLSKSHVTQTIISDQPDEQEKQAAESTSIDSNVVETKQSAADTGAEFKNTNTNTETNEDISSSEEGEEVADGS